MNKLEYLSRLEACLKRKLSKAEIDDIMRDYAEYFEEGRRQSKPDSEISAKLGDPELVARQILEESAENAGYSSINMREEWKRSKEDVRQWEVGKSAKGCLSSLLKIIGLIILFPIALVAVFGGAAFLLLLLGILMGILAFPMVSAVLGLVGLFLSVLAISCSFPTVGVVGIFASIACLALSVCITALVIWLIRILFRVAQKIFFSLKNSLFPSAKAAGEHQEPKAPQNEKSTQVEEEMPGWEEQYREDVPTQEEESEQHD